MLLCDAAEQVGGKLYILGGGWSIIWIPRVPINMALAVKIAVPWDQTNRPVRLKAMLMTADGEPVDFGEGPVEAGGEATVGRPPHVKPGTPLDLPFALTFAGIALEPGGYRWELEVDGKMAATAPFRVMEGIPGQVQAPGGGHG
jgi:hypothetical protein